MQETRIPLKFKGRVAHQPPLHSEEIQQKARVHFQTDAPKSTKLS